MLEQQGNRAPVVIGVVGRSGSGKTSLLERLIASIEARGVSVGATKHASHGFEADRKGKDSHRLYQAGARAVALLSGEQSATFVRRTGPPSLEGALAALPPDLDLVLAEGFSWEPIPRIVVRGPGHAPKPEDLAGGEVIAVAEVRRYPDDGPAQFDRELLEALAETLLARVDPWEPPAHSQEAS